MIIDISQELRSCRVFPGDDQPTYTKIKSMDNGDLFNLSHISLYVHNGTHVDAPYHFINEGKTISDIPLDVYVGDCYVETYNGVLDSLAAESIMKHAIEAKAFKRILIRGDATVSQEAAKVFSSYDILLLGNESQTVGPVNAPMAVHLELLGKGITLLEGIVLNHVEDGKYFLSCAPLNIQGSDGAMCRAYLIKD